MMPGAPPASTPTAIFEPLALELARCCGIIMMGYLCRRASVFTPSEIEGISAFVARLALPALIFLSMATLDITAVEWPLVGAILLGKSVLFALAVITTWLLSAAEWKSSSDCFSIRSQVEPSFALSPLPQRRPGAVMGLQEPFTLGGPSDLEASCAPAALLNLSGAAAGISTTRQSRAWMRRAGLFAIFVTQSNDFALGIPLIKAIWGDRFESTVFVVSPVQFGVLNPIAFALMEAAITEDRELAAPHSSLDLPISSSGQTRGMQSCTATTTAPMNRLRCFVVLRKVGRSPVVMATALGLLSRAVLGAAGVTLPAMLRETLAPVSGAFTGTALITLGLSLKAHLAALRFSKVSALCLLLAKVPHALRPALCVHDLLASARASRAHATRVCCVCTCSMHVASARATSELRER